MSGILMTRKAIQFRINVVPPDEVLALTPEQQASWVLSSISCTSLLMTYVKQTQMVTGQFRDDVGFEKDRDPVAVQ
jgi:hypothetical protein